MGDCDAPCNSLNLLREEDAMRWLEAKNLPKKEAPAHENKMQRPTPNKTATPKRDVHVKAPVIELAERLGVDITLVKGTGKDGEITLNDVRNAQVTASDFGSK
jgi:pyruvate/2-oxoglutarate dehydrogenase complex dihydrolipoamide acyltransferase (E2) component